MPKEFRAASRIYGFWFCKHLINARQQSELICISSFSEGHITSGKQKSLILFGLVVLIICSF